MSQGMLSHSHMNRVEHGWDSGSQMFHVSSSQNPWYASGVARLHIDMGNIDKLLTFGRKILICIISMRPHYAEDRSQCIQVHYCCKFKSE